MINLIHQLLVVLLLYIAALNEHLDIILSVCTVFLLGFSLRFRSSHFHFWQFDERVVVGLPTVVEGRSELCGIED